MLIELAIVPLLIAINGVLAGAEIAVVSVRKTRIQTLVAQRHGGAIALDTLRRNPERFLATVQIGITSSRRQPVPSPEPRSPPTSSRSWRRFPACRATRTMCRWGWSSR